MRRLPAKWLCIAGLILALLPVPRPQAAPAFQCALGHRISADLGDGVTLYSCSWEKTPGEFVRTGPLQLVRNGILILRLQTDRNGRLQGEYRSWDDDGVLTESGHYRDGLRHGEWRSIDADGNPRVIVFHAGLPVSR